MADRPDQITLAVPIVRAVSHAEQERRQQQRTEARAAIDNAVSRFGVGAVLGWLAETCGATAEDLRAAAEDIGRSRASRLAADIAAERWEHAAQLCESAAERVEV